MAKGKGADGGDWLASLARQAAAADVPSKPNHATKRKRKGGGGGKNRGADVNNDGVATAEATTLTKAQRIERREHKKAQREERKRAAEEKRQERIAKKRLRAAKQGAGSAAAMANSGEARTQKSSGSKGRKRRGMTPSSAEALARLSTALDTTNVIQSATFQQSKQDKKRREDSAQDALVNGLPAQPSGKATKRGTLRPDSKELQPRIRDYNGQGLVRPSLYLPFDDPSFLPKLELEFDEHVPGFFGKAKQKAAKKQADANMLWKRCLKAKEGEEEVDGGGGKRKKRKKWEGKLEGMMREGVM
ncbi:hypothetical protein ACHAXT_007307 [Thalassiosira profunda]